MLKNHNDKSLKISAVEAEKLEQKSAMKVDKEAQSGFDNMWQKMVLNSYSINDYNLSLYLIFTEKLKEINKLAIPINQGLFFLI